MKKVQYFCVLTRTGDTARGRPTNVTFIDVVDVVTANATAKEVFEYMVKASDAKLVEDGVPFTSPAAIVFWSMQPNAFG